MEGKLEEVWRAGIRTQRREGQVVQTEVLRAGQDVGVRLDAGDQLAQHDAVREHVRLLVVPLSLEALRGHPVGRAHGGQPVAAPANRTHV